MIPEQNPNSPDMLVWILPPLAAVAVALILGPFVLPYLLLRVRPSRSGWTRVPAPNDESDETDERAHLIPVMGPTDPTPSSSTTVSSTVIDSMSRTIRVKIA